MAREECSRKVIQSQWFWVDVVWYVATEWKAMSSVVRCGIWTDLVPIFQVEAFARVQVETSWDLRLKPILDRQKRAIEIGRLNGDASANWIKIAEGCVGKWLLECRLMNCLPRRNQRIKLSFIQLISNDQEWFHQSAKYNVKSPT